ncbi:MAG: hypothetical protein J7L82_01570, partial [Staphylothermus sp.]|nr:hypothetical protein [Staphylothermus sp.]
NELEVEYRIASFKEYFGYTLDEIRKHIGEVFFIHAHRDCNSFEICRELITKYLSRIRRT